MAPNVPEKLMGDKHLCYALQERIEQGRYAPGAWLPTERALAQEFALDRSTVRRALRQLEEQGLIVREAGKRPWVQNRGSHERQNVNRPDTRRSALGTLVAILPQHPIYPASLAILHGINAAVRSAEAPFRLQVIDTHGGSERSETNLEMKALDSVLQEDIAGVVLWHMGGVQTLPHLRKLQHRGTPVVFVDRFPPELICDFVGSDNQTGIEEAISYLRHLGHRRIAHLTTDEKTTTVQERIAAYTSAMMASGAVPPPELIFRCPHDLTRDVAPAFAQFFGLEAPPTAVLAMNDALAYRFIAECQRHGKDVPGDISVMGIDDLDGHAARPSLLTTLHQPFDRIGYRAAELLLRLLAEPKTAQDVRRHILLPTPLVIRSTCQPPSGHS